MTATFLVVVDPRSAAGAAGPLVVAAQLESRSSSLPPKSGHRHVHTVIS
jgi:hypothetical protein